MRRDRVGEVVDDDQDDANACPYRCRRGWLDRDGGRACPACKPWLAARPARRPTAAELAAYRERHPATG